MKIGLIVLLVAVLLAGCASHRAVVPALDGAPRVPVNRDIPATVPFTAPNNTTQGG